MPQAAKGLDQEYWRPVISAANRANRPSLADSFCSRCGVEYPARARFCHVCGAGRDPRPARLPLSFADYFDLDIIRQKLGLSVVCLVFFLAGAVCMLAAASLNLFYKAVTLADWQAIQTWRIEWLLGAVALFLAGILLKKKRA